jgi:putative FmdB family regulatory protein
MPTYDYECRECGHVFEVRASISQKTAGFNPECPKCHGHVTDQAFRSITFIGRSSGGADTRGPVGGCGPLCGPGPC